MSSRSVVLNILYGVDKGTETSQNEFFQQKYIFGNNEYMTEHVGVNVMMFFAIHAVGHCSRDKHSLNNLFNEDENYTGCF